MYMMAFLMSQYIFHRKSLILDNSDHLKPSELHRSDLTGKKGLHEII